MGVNFEFTRVVLILIRVIPLNPPSKGEEKIGNGIINCIPTPPSGYNHGCPPDLRGPRAGILQVRVYLNRRWQ